MDWLECNNKRIVKQVSIDEGMINSLLKTSKDKIDSEQLLPLKDTTTGSKVTLAYDALRELLEALSLKKGFKIYNHECYTAFLKEIIGDSLLGDSFDEVRKLRNSINYYGKQLTKEGCEETVKQMKEIINKIQSWGVV